MTISKTRKLLIDKLFSIWNNKNFVIGVICNLKSDDEVQHIIRFIQNNKGASTDDILLESLRIDSERNK